MKLYKLPLNKFNRAVWKDISNPYSMHQSLTNSLIGYNNKSDKRQYLYRLEEDRNGNYSILLMSHLEFDLSKRFEEGWLSEKIEPKEYNPNFKDGDICRFRLTANVTKKVKNPDTGKPVVIPCILNTTNDNLADGEKTSKEEIHAQWLKRKGVQHGFIFNPDALQSSGFKQNMKKGAFDNVNLYGVRFDGYLKVTDSEIFNQALINGIGRSKSMGFGLLSAVKVM